MRLYHYAYVRNLEIKQINFQKLCECHDKRHALEKHPCFKHVRYVLKDGPNNNQRWNEDHVHVNRLLVNESWRLILII